MDKTDIDTLISLREYLSVAHHVPGRIRLKLNPAIRQALGLRDSSAIERAVQAVPGIRQVRLNTLAGSVVVEYASDIIQPVWWQTLLASDEQQARTLLASVLP